jgi:hypothetical protein
LSVYRTVCGNSRLQRPSLLLLHIHVYMYIHSRSLTRLAASSQPLSIPNEFPKSSSPNSFALRSSTSAINTPTAPRSPPSPTIRTLRTSPDHPLLDIAVLPPTGSAALLTGYKWLLWLLSLVVPWPRRVLELAGVLTRRLHFVGGGRKCVCA